MRSAGIPPARLGGRQLVSFLQELRPRFEALAQALPNVSSTIARLSRLSTLRLSEARGSPSVINTSVFKLSPRAASFAAWLAHQLQQPDISVDQLKNPVYLDAVAVLWLHSVAIRNFGDPPLEGSLPNHPYPDRVITSLQKSRNLPGALDSGYLSWIESVKQHSPGSELISLFKSLRVVEERAFEQLGPGQSRPPPRLDERGLSTAHWYHPRPAELKKLQEFINRELDPQHHTRYRHEAGLIALSIATCRDVHSLLRWKFHDLEDDDVGENRFRLSVRPTRYGNRLFAEWHKIEHGVRSAVASVRLPHVLSKWLISLHPGVGTQRLYRLLPVTAGSDWAKQAYECLAQELNCTPARAELITRDLLVRLLYERTTNSALTRFWRSDALNQIERVDRVALSHYLQPSGHRADISYDQALCDALGVSEKWPMANVKVQLGSAPLSEGWVRHILKELTTATNLASDPIDRHNAVAHLSLFVSILGTGHRRSTSPFPFPWDFFPSERLVFICDKMVTGSEARFVPLSPTVLSYLEDYAAHLIQLAGEISLPTATRTYARNTADLLGFCQDPPSSIKSLDFVPHAGTFFLLKKDGTVTRKPLTTNGLDTYIKQLTNATQTVRRLRTTIGQNLWEQGCSGRVIQAFLGHQPELHVHGPASTWSVMDVAQKLSPAIEQYFQRNLELSPRPVKTWQPTRYRPSLQAFAHDPEHEIFAPGYEGRHRENEWAQQRARSVIRRELSEYLLSTTTASGIRIDSSERKRLEERVRQELGSDPIGQKKVNAELEKQLDRLRGHPDSQIEVVERAFYLSAPGPIDIGFSRNLTLALSLRTIWADTVGTSVGRPRFDPTERLAQLTISLACFDGVIAPENLKGLVLAAAAGDYEVHGQHITLRCNIVTHTHDHEFCTRPGYASSALILGSSDHPSDASVEWTEIETRVCEILTKITRLESTTKWSIARLCLVMQPYWLLHLPGAMYSVAIGESKGPAADERAEAQLHGKELPSDLSAASSSSTRIQTQKSSKSLVLAGLRKLFTNARGILERGERRRVVQRAKLRAGLRSSLAQEILHLGQDTQIVGLLLSFIGRLLESGGPRKAVLALSSIETYFSSIAQELLEHAWDFDFESAEPEELQTLFEKIADRVSPKCRDVVLNLFCNHLRDELAIPYFSSRWFSPREPVRVRASLALPAHVTRAIGSLHRQKSEAARHAAVFLAIAHGYGLRRLEVFGLSESQFDAVSPMCLSVRKTQIADLKTRAGRRVIAKTMATAAIDSHIKQAVTLARTTNRDTGFIFESPTRDNHIAKVNPIVAQATEALRHATGSLSVVPHSLRHSFATLVGLAMMAPEKGSGRHLEALAAKFLSESYSYQARTLLCIPKDWPFGVDALAMALGQTTPSTLLNVYFHASHLVIADRCEALQPRHITQVRLSTMLAKERTALSKLGKRLTASQDGQSFDSMAVVHALIRRLDSDDTPPVTKEHELGSSSPDRWELFFRALVYRLEGDRSLEEMRDYLIEGLGVSTEVADKTISVYEELVLESAMDDFEPDSSSLVEPVTSHRVGVVRSGIEREDFVARVQAWTLSDLNNATRLRNLMHNWKERVKADNPAIVCRNESELNEALSILRALGADDSQLALRLHGDIDNTWLCQVLARFPKSETLSIRASRGNTRVKINEVSLNVRQKQNSRVPDGRDLHRALVGLFVAAR